MSAVLYGETEGRGPDLVILHGLMGSLGNWRGVARSLSSSFRVTRLDLPNHGRSPELDSDRIGTWADTVYDAVSSRGIRKMVLLGHSLGGKIAMAFASRFPGSLRGLVVVDISPRALPPAHLFVLRACRALPLSTLSSRAEIRAALMKWIPFGQTCDFLLRNLRYSESGGVTWGIPLDLLIKNYRVVSDALPLSDPYGGEVSFILGGDSSFHVERDKASILKQFPRAVFHRVPAAGHLVHFDSPEEFIEVLKSDLIRMEGSLP